MKPTTHDDLPIHKTAVEQEQIPRVGEVGIFWFFKGQILMNSVAYTHGEEYGDFINGTIDHCTFWAKFRSKIPGANQYEYDQVARGRVVYSKRGKRFLVYGSETFVKDVQRRAIVLSRFTLPAEDTIFRTDEHYSDIAGMAED